MEGWVQPYGPPLAFLKWKANFDRDQGLGSNRCPGCDMGIVLSHVMWVQHCSAHRLLGERIGCQHEHAGEMPKFLTNKQSMGPMRQVPMFPLM